MSRRAPPHPVALIAAPTNLGLRPGPAGKLAGTTRAPAALEHAGLSRALGAAWAPGLAAMEYSRDAQGGSRIRNADSLRAFTLKLASIVENSLKAGQFPLVVGGDCSNLLGCLLGLRRHGGRGLIHIDGHSDFFHPGNYDDACSLRSAAGMDLALATGRGEPVLTEWPSINGPLVADADACQIGERESEDTDYPFSELDHLTIGRILIRRFHQLGPTAAAHQVQDWAERRGITRAWIHLDIDVIDQALMPAVDSPGSPGMTFQELATLLGILLATGRIAGMDLAIYDPDMDPSGHDAASIVHCLSDAFRGKP
ncbi:arginase [Gluconacetobacter sacchari DSM 12717]|uniref:Arginase family protein n=2 Tax=Gluconacetobacter sacchari TaxID=92759 RepID=A0A7W4NR00_9PROT|nr:arginase family protein [Gluconacetobacter sacchari]MBB2159630.1 arginase family protein [Gluconacetobacter sacchari]GBQ25145.1 arginase [Gluconacetobacter sacchari DSM 12717]